MADEVLKYIMEAEILFLAPLSCATGIATLLRRSSRMKPSQLRGGLIYCLSSAPDSAAIRETHAEAHGLLPAYTFEVTEGDRKSVV